MDPLATVLSRAEGCARARPPARRPQERYIVATVGNFSVSWNFKRFKVAAAPGQPNKSFWDYKLTEKSAVVDSGFMHANWNPEENPLVMATRAGNVYAIVDDEEDEEADE